MIDDFRCSSTQFRGKLTQNVKNVPKSYIDFSLDPGKVEIQNEKGVHGKNNIAEKTIQNFSSEKYLS